MYNFEHLSDKDSLSSKNDVVRKAQPNAKNFAFTNVNKEECGETH